MRRLAVLFCMWLGLGSQDRAEGADARASGPDEVSLGYRSQPTPRAAFAAIITRMDRDVGRLADLVRSQGPDARTLLMFTSDNGPHKEGGGDPVFFGSSGGLRGMKRDLYEGGIRVPMIARWPYDRKFRAFDKSTGERLWEAVLPFSATGIYVAFALPNTPGR